ncbi:MAG: methyltransferase domain-containing protein, partial [Rhodospirillaceae bacterium]|nr:methyltransferase domain-containing protein [Rhodospirillaceae bacterium]
MELFDAQAPDWANWIAKNQYFHDQDAAYLRFLIPEGASVLELGCGTGHLLKALNPARGVGVDLSPKMVDVARQLHPDLTFHLGDIEDDSILTALTGPFDAIILSDTLGYLEDCEELLARLHPLCSRDTRIIIGTYSHLWEPVFKLASKLGLKLDHVDATWLSFGDISNMLDLAGFQVVRRESRQLLPRALLGRKDCDFSFSGLKTAASRL